MKDIEISQEKRSKFTGEEKMWCNKLFKFLYGNKEVRRKNVVLMMATYFESPDELEIIKKPMMRKVIHFIRNEIIPVNAGKVVRAIDLDNLPESYKKGTFWIDATNKGYLATKDTEKIEKHIETLTSRCEQIGKDIESARLVIKALKRLEEK